MKPIYKLLILFALIVSHQFSNNCYGQNNSIVLDGAYMVMDGGTAANNIFIVVEQTSPAGIVRLPSGGHIHSENQYNAVKWLSGATTGSYVFPFGIGGTAADYIPFTFNKTIGNSSVSSATWGTTIQNAPRPAATNVGPVTNMLGVTDSVAYAIDRFWDIRATTTTADLTFSYKGSENTTSSPGGIIQAQHWNGNSWDTPVGPGNAGVTTGIGTAGPFAGQNTFSPWVLIIPCNPDTLTLNPILCQGATFTVGTSTYSTTGIYKDTLTNILGCDSIVTTNLTVNPIATGIDVQAACATFTWIDGNTYTTSNSIATFTIVGGAVTGCDSIVTLNLTISNSVTGTDTQSACNTFTWIDGNTYTSNNNAAVFTIVGGSSNGCDSIVTLNLTINSAATGIDTKTACGVYTWIDGNTYTTNNNSAIFTIVGGASTGCDSIVTLNLTIQNAPNVVAFSNGPICVGATLTLNAVPIPGATYQWSGPNGFTNTTVNPVINNAGIANAGTYQIIASISSYCADTTLVNVVISPLPVLTSIVTSDSCATDVGQIEIVVTSPNAPFTYNWSNGTTNPTATGLSAGGYQVTVTDNLACKSTASYTVFNNIDDCRCFVYVANAFSPNGDLNNDVIPVRGECVKFLSFKIFNRWGNLVFETDKLNDGWDGYIRDELQNTGVYVYTLEATFENGKSVKESGDISLIR